MLHLKTRVVLLLFTMTLQKRFEKDVIRKKTLLNTRVVLLLFTMTLEKQFEKRR
jgi:hypothetical protein